MSLVGAATATALLTVLSLFGEPALPPAALASAPAREAPPVAALSGPAEALEEPVTESEGAGDAPAPEGPAGSPGPEPASAVELTGLEPAGSDTVLLEGRLGSGETIAAALRGHGVSPSEVHGLVSALRPLYDFRRAPAGAAYELRFEEEALRRFCFRPGPLESYEVRCEPDGRLLPAKLSEEPEVVEAEVLVRIDSSLYEAISRAGESPALAAHVADVFAWDLDFSRDQRPGDTFRMIVEKRFFDGELIGYGRVLAAEYVGRKGTHRAFWFRPDGEEKGHYFLEDGRSAEKSFLATPVQYTRVSSRFGPRRHPILGFTKAHNGTDYAAPRGTPVRAMADGVVRHAGWRGASGKLVVLDHENGLRSYYAHLHRISSGIRPGARVSQKTVIGRVGTTGRSTGPHLHLGIKKHGRWIDPQRLKVSRADPVPERHRDAFDALVERRRVRLARLAPAERRDAGDEPDAVEVAALAD